RPPRPHRQRLAHPGGAQPDERRLRTGTAQRPPHHHRPPIPRRRPVPPPQVALSFASTNCHSERSKESASQTSCSCSKGLQNPLGDRRFSSSLAPGAFPIIVIPNAAGRRLFLRVRSCVLFASLMVLQDTTRRPALERNLSSKHGFGLK